MQTDTADHADIVLPATAFLEHTDLYFAYGHYYLQLARPGSGARPNLTSRLRLPRGTYGLR
jgi:anaerobic selenocysteine-containing dehydrogenase